MEWNAWSAGFLFLFSFYPAGLSVGLKSTSPKIAKTLSGSEFRVVKSTCHSEVCILATTCGSETCVLANTCGPGVCVSTGSRWCVVWWRHWAKVRSGTGSLSGREKHRSICSLLSQQTASSVHSTIQILLILTPQSNWIHHVDKM